MKAHRVEPVRDGRGDLAESPEQVLSFGGLLMLLVEPLEFLLELVDAAGDRGGARLEFLLVDEPALKGIEQAAAFSADPRHPLFRLLELAREKRHIKRRAVPHGGLCAQEELGMEEVPAHLLPDQRVERGRANMAGTAPRAPRQYGRDGTAGAQAVEGAEGGTRVG